jgi:hypothetical protein
MSAPELPDLRHAFPLLPVEQGPALPPAHNGAPWAGYPHEGGMAVPVVDGTTGEVISRHVHANASRETGGGERTSLDGKRVTNVHITRPGASNNSQSGYRPTDETRAITPPTRRGELTQGIRLMGGGPDTGEAPVVTTAERALARVRQDRVPTGRVPVDGSIGPLSWATRTADDGPGFADRAMARIGEDPELERKGWMRAAAGAATAALARSRWALSRILSENSGDLPTLHEAAAAVPLTEPGTGMVYGTPVNGPPEAGTTASAVAGPAPRRVRASVSAPAITAKPDAEPAAGAGSSGTPDPCHGKNPDGSTQASEATQAVAWFGDGAAPAETLTAPAAVTYTAPETDDPQIALLYTHYQQAATSGDPAHRARAWQFYRDGMTQGYAVDKPPFADPAGIYFDAEKIRGSAAVPINTARPARAADRNTTSGVVAPAGERGEPTGVIRWNTRAGLPDRSVRRANVAAEEPAPTSSVVDAEVIYTPGTPEFDARMGELTRMRIMLEDEVRHGISDPGRAAEVDRQTEAVLRETAALMRASSDVQAAAEKKAAGGEPDPYKDANGRPTELLMEKLLSGLRRL